jgi:pyruvate ferredoxin oxidoreductase gamma subunit
MFQVRFHGRGGQGVVTAAEVLSYAAFLEGKHAQAFPSFGSERTGAPVVSFCRIDDKEIRLREPILEPDALIVQDPTLSKAADIFQGLRRDGYLLVNTTRSFADLHIADRVATMPAGHARIVAASELAVKHIGRPLPNAALLGGFAAVTAKLSIESVEHAIRAKFAGKVGEGNAAAARAAYEALVAAREPQHA